MRKCKGCDLEFEPTRENHYYHDRQCKNRDKEPQVTQKGKPISLSDMCYMAVEASKARFGITSDEQLYDYKLRLRRLKG